MRIYLMGFMGSGKTYTGKKLAARRSVPFIDLDDRIEAKAKTSIREIFKEKGENYFRLLEQNVLHETIHEKEGIIACGGGTPCFFDNMDWMNKHGITVYLKADSQILRDRLMAEMAHRPLLKGLTEKDLLHFIEQKNNDREVFYQKAHIIYHQTEKSTEVASELDGKLLEIIGH